MLIKTHHTDFLEDFGMITETGQVFLYENGLVKRKNTYKWSNVVRVYVVWLDKDLKVQCEVADTAHKRQIGLSKHDDLDDFNGMLFPFTGPQEVKFHQSTVPFSLDILFFRDSELIKLIQMTDPSKDEHWSCDDCDMVLEVNGGFCIFNDVQIGDRLAFFAVSEQDLIDLEEEKRITSQFLNTLPPLDE